MAKKKEATAEVEKTAEELVRELCKGQTAVRLDTTIKDCKISKSGAKVSFGSVQLTSQHVKILSSFIESGETVVLTILPMQLGLPLEESDEEKD